MKIVKLCTIVLASSLFAMTSVPPRDASAAASAKAALLNVTITLVDLDVDDAVAPAITFNRPATTSSSAYGDPLNGFPTRPSPNVAVLRFDSVDAFLGSTTATVVFPGSTSVARTTPTSVVAEASTSHGSATAYAQTFLQYATEQDWLGFALTPNSALTISADAALRVTSDGTSVGPTYWLNSYAEAYVSMTLSTLDGFGFDPSAQSIFLDLVTPWETAVALEEEHRVSLTLTNSTATVLNGSIALGTSVIVSSPVPEPDAIMLMSCGLSLLFLKGVVGSRARRKLTTSFS